jgi:hypothetical protein
MKTGFPSLGLLSMLFVPLLEVLHNFFFLTFWKQKFYPTYFTFIFNVILWFFLLQVWYECQYYVISMHIELSLFLWSGLSRSFP